MKQRWITGICIVAVLFPILYIGGWILDAAATILIMIGCFEITRLMNHRWPTVFNLSMYGCMILMLVGAYFGPVWLQIVDIGLIIYLFAWQVFSDSITLDEIAIMFIFFNIFGLLFLGLHTFYTIDRLLVFVMISGTCVTDAFALFSGMAFGKHKMDERISPHKTWEGAAGGYLIGAISTFLFSYFLVNVPLSLTISAALILPATGQIGDLAFSSIKRHFKIKDFGNIFPGHGGVLDRLDSISFNTIMLYMLVLIIL